MKKRTRKPKHRRQYETRPIASLQPHPAQAEIFNDLSEVELQLLAKDIDANGLRYLPEILPDGTIIAGHQRVRALQLLGRAEVRCWVRDDLDRLGENAIEERLISDNLNRRQLSPLAVARCYLRLRELERDGYYSEQDSQGDLRDHLAQRFQVDGRTLDRYARMLKAPVAVQYAFERGQLAQKDVLDVVRLDVDQQEEIAQRLHDGEDPRSVVAQYLKSEKNKAGPLIAVSRLIRDLDRGLAALKGRYKKIKGHMWRDALEVLADAEEFLPTLRRHLDEQHRRTEEATAALRATELPGRTK